jgi:hypothetical protein
MSIPGTRTTTKSASRLTLDTWAVLFALAAAALIRFGVILHVPW